jgi:hypothetical protein
LIRDSERFDGLKRALRPLLPPRRSSSNGNSAEAGPGPGPAPPPSNDAEIAELTARRDRLIEKFTIMQSDLGGSFYEMAIRDHVRLDVLTRKAAELQSVDAELAQVERALELQRSGAVGSCPNCQAPYGSGESFCSQCGTALTAAPAPR